MTIEQYNNIGREYIKELNRNYTIKDSDAGKNIRNEVYTKYVEFNELLEVVDSSNAGVSKFIANTLAPRDDTGVVKDTYQP